jgi:hypothetical protein
MLIVTHLVKKLTVCYRTVVFISLPLDPVLRQLNVVHTSTYHSSKIHINVILQSRIS